MNRVDAVTPISAREAPYAKRIALLIVIYLAFVSLGLPDGVHGLAWPAVRASLGEPLEAIGLVTLVLASCSAISGFLSARILARYGTGPVTFVSALMTGLSLVGIAQLTSFPLMVALAFPLGLGAGSVDAGLNHFVAEHYSSKHMNWLHACWGVGATLGPVIMSSSLASKSGWSQGYLTLAFFQLSLACVLFASLGLWKGHRRTHHDHEKLSQESRPNAPRWTAILAPFLFVLYIAMEAGPGIWAASILIESRHFDPGMAGLGITLFFGSIMGGRVLVGFVSERMGNRRLVRLGLSVALAGIVLLMIPGAPTLALAGLILLGLGSAPIYPGLMHEAPRRFDPITARKVIGWQVAATYIGGAIIPTAFGLLAARLGLEAVFPAIACFIVLLLVLSTILDKATPT